MHEPRFGLSKSSSWWSSPNVCATSWHITILFHAGVLYVDNLKYESFTFTVPCTICVPLTQTLATPSHPLKPYLALHTSTRPLVGTQFFGVYLPLVLFVPPATIAVSSTADPPLQSVEAV